MRGVVWGVILLLGCANPAPAAEGIAADDEAGRIGYSLGHQIGGDYRRQGVELHREALTQGIRDGLAGREPRLDAMEMEAILQGLKRDIRGDRRAEATTRFKEHQKEKERRKEEGEAFLAANRHKAGVKTTASGLQYKVLRAGTGPTPAASDTVTVDYRGTLIDGKEFFSTYRRGKPGTFRVDGVIRGCSEALQLMKEGAKWELYIPWELAYGSREPLDYRTVIFQVELLAIGEPAATDTTAQP